MLFLLLSLLTTGWSMAQTDGVLIEGEMRHKKTREPLQNVTVTVMNGDDIFDSFEADGRYSYEVPFDGDYTLMFGVVDMVPQSVQVNASQVPEDLHGDVDPLTWPVMLFDYVEGFDMSVVNEPFGIFDFDEDRESMEFDRSHSSRMKGALDDEMDRLGNQGREAERNQRGYEYAMEDAQKAERKGRWSVAKEEYEQALQYKPGDAEASAGLERATLALNPESASTAENAAEQAPPAVQESAVEKESSPLKLCCLTLKKRWKRWPFRLKSPQMRRKKDLFRRSAQKALLTTSHAVKHRCCLLLKSPSEPCRPRS